MSTRYKATIMYDGYDYYGFEKQGDLKTIELSLNKAFILWLKEDVKIVGSGRTDKKVSAKGQVIHFDLPSYIKPSGVKMALNSFLPLDIRIVKVEVKGINFHARFSAVKKEYRYTINVGKEDAFSYRYAPVFHNLDLAVLEEALKLFIGKHNFRGFASAQVDQRKDFNKTIYEAYLKRKGKFITIHFIGNGFLKYQVRRMVGILIDIAYHKFTKEKIIEIFNSGDPKISHRVAPGEGLVLYKVYYEE